MMSGKKSSSLIEKTGQSRNNENRSQNENKKERKREIWQTLATITCKQTMMGIQKIKQTNSDKKKIQKQIKQKTKK